MNPWNLTIVTPCSRQQNLIKLYESIDFLKTYKWIICYDTSKSRIYQKQFEGNEKVLELFADGTEVKSQAGHHQRNIALEQIEDGYVYMLDDDNIMHPDFFKTINLEHIFNNLQLNKKRFIITFNSIKKDGIIWTSGNNIKLNYIDTSNFIIHKSVITEKWNPTNYGADGEFIQKMVITNDHQFLYINEHLAYYNFLR